MTFQVPPRVATLAGRMWSMRHLRKVKFFIAPRTLTVITYYRDQQVGGRPTYQGKAYIFTYTAWRGTTVALAHTSHLPPPETGEDETEIELVETTESEPARLLPGFGF